MKTKKRELHLAIAIFPNLFLDQEVSVDGVVIKPSYKETIGKESLRVRKVVTTLKKIFLRHNNLPITHFCYANTYIGSEKGWRNITKKLKRFSTILLFDELSKDWIAKPVHYFDFYLFELNRKQINEIEKMDRVDASLNGETRVYFYVKKEGEVVITPPCYDHNYKALTDIYRNEILQSLHFFRNHLFTQEEYPRFLRAIEWYNRSFFKPAGFDESESVTNMQTALEALFKVFKDGREQNVMSQVMSGICNFLGSTPDLRTWVDEFWGLRNKIVHGDIDIPSFQYKPLGSQTEYFNNVYFARHVFVRCLHGIIHLRKKLPVKYFHDQMKPNDVRLKDAEKLLKKAKHKLERAHKNGALKMIASLREGDLTAKVDQSLVFGKKFFHFVLLSLDKKDDTQADLANRIQAILDCEENNYEEQGKLYRHANKINPWRFIDRQREKRRELIELGYALESFMKYMTYRLIMHEY